MSVSPVSQPPPSSTNRGMAPGDVISGLKDGGSPLDFIRANLAPTDQTQVVVSKPAPGSLEAKGGRGLVLMRAFMDDVKFNSQGNEVTLVMRREAAVV